MFTAEQIALWNSITPPAHPPEIARAIENLEHRLNEAFTRIIALEREAALNGSGERG